MRILPGVIAAITLSTGAVCAAPVSFAAEDGVTVHADYQGQGRRALIVLFHQAGSNLHEYDTIVPRLQAAGFDTLAVSQRSGGNLFGGKNETAQGVAGEAEYLDAYPDMEAALNWAKSDANATRMIVWGSSYSSSLVFKLASEHPKGVAGVMSFSPGNYFGTRFLPKDAAAGVKAPVFVTSASDEDEVSAARAIMAAVPGAATQFVPKQGLHGSSSLREDMNPNGAEEIWQAVEAFLIPLRS